MLVSATRGNLRANSGDQERAILFLLLLRESTPMKHIRFSVAAVLIAVALVGIGLGALESNSALVTSLVFSAHLGWLCVSLVGAFIARGDARAFWAGLASFGWVYSLVAFGFLFPTQRYNTNAYVWWGYPSMAQPEQKSELFTSTLLDWYATLRVRPKVGSQVIAQWRGGGYWPAQIQQINGSSILVAWTDGSPPEWVTASQIQSHWRDLERVGHSLFSPLAALLGGIVCWYLFADRKVAAPELSANETQVIATD